MDPRVIEMNDLTASASNAANSANTSSSSAADILLHNISFTSCNCTVKYQRTSFTTKLEREISRTF